MVCILTARLNCTVSIKAIYIQLPQTALTFDVLPSCLNSQLTTTVLKRLLSSQTLDLSVYEDREFAGLRLPSCLGLHHPSPYLHVVRPTNLDYACAITRLAHYQNTSKDQVCDTVMVFQIQ